MRYRQMVGSCASLAAAVVTTCALLAAAGCGGKPKYPSCDGDKDCKKGEHCIDKKCVQCGDDSHCAEGETCKAGACVKKGCSTDDDCADGKVCKDGQCVACESDGECGPGGRCDNGACIRPGQCKKDEDCADDEDCIDGRCQGAGAGAAGACNLTTVYFDFDTSVIREDSRSVLEANAQCLKSANRASYVVGHTDPRGTEEYNIALADGRARAVADYLARLGIDPAKLQIVPKGEAEATGGDESTWTKDRRVEFEWK
jgi:peptidoglycan-associated lipoprotein